MFDRTSGPGMVFKPPQSPATMPQARRENTPILSGATAVVRPERLPDRRPNQAAGGSAGDHPAIHHRSDAAVQRLGVAVQNGGGRLAGVRALPPFGHLVIPGPCSGKVTRPAALSPCQAADGSSRPRSAGPQHRLCSSAIECGPRARSDCGTSRTCPGQGWRIRTVRCARSLFFRSLTARIGGVPPSGLSKRSAPSSSRPVRARSLAATLFTTSWTAWK